MACALAKSDTLYHPLTDDEIRLVYILPGGLDDMIRCHLSDGRLNPIRNFAKFRAVSYTWGDPTDTVPILVDGHIFNATRNLHQLLHTLRKTLTSIQPFWIDAICLNQADDVEKAKQVPRMSDIYSLAEDVILWLGLNTTDEDDDIGRAFEAITELHEISKTSESKDLTTYVKTLEQSHPAVHQKLKSTGHAWELLDRRPWFTRAWIVQEVSLANSRAVLQAGQHSTSLAALEFFMGAFHLSGSNALLAPRIFTMLGTRIWFKAAAEQECKSDYGSTWRESSQWATFSDLLLQLLLRTCGVQCYLPHDRIYALWGLVGKLLKDDISSELLPDYSMSWDKVYQVYAMHLIDSTADLRVLAFKRSSLPAHTPSWVPDFRHLGTSRSIPPSSPKGRLGFSEDGKVLENLRGVRLGHCVGFVPPWPQETKGYFESIIQTILRPRSELLGITLNESFEDFHHAVGRCLSLSSQFEGNENIDDEDVENLRLLSDDVEDRYDDDGDDGDAISNEGAPRRNFKALKRWGKVLLSDGTIGEFIRQDVVVEDGDVVVAFRGAVFPLILRPAADACFELVGACSLASPRKLTESFFEGRTLEAFNMR
ncbi:HET domain-containing protein [Microdochium nivale]|nr:HET domain-containing protein [Microdochium nivale]